MSIQPVQLTPQQEQHDLAKDDELPRVVEVAADLFGGDEFVNPVAPADKEKDDLHKLKTVEKIKPIYLIGGVDQSNVEQVLKDQLDSFFQSHTKQIGFFTSVKYSNEGAAVKAQGWKERSIEFFDGYFFLGGEQAVIDTSGSKKEVSGTLVRVKEPWYMIALKVISYATLIIPAIMLIGKVIARSQVQYKVYDFTTPTNKSGSEQLLNSDLGIDADFLQKLCEDIKVVEKHPT